MNRLPRNLATDDGGAAAIFIGLALSAIMGLMALGLHAATAVQTHRKLQEAADNAAIGAALALRSAPGDDPARVARAILAGNGTVAHAETRIGIYHPPASGQQMGDWDAIQVTIQRPSPLRFGHFFGAADRRLGVSATATLIDKAHGCILALDNRADAIRVDHPADLQVDGCLPLSMADGLNPTMLHDADPWHAVELPGLSRCDALLSSISGPRTISAKNPSYGFCAGLRVRSGGRLTLGPGVYVVAGNLTVESGGSIEGNGVTLILMPGGTANVKAGAQIALRAPLAGPTAGLVLAANLLAGGTTSLTGGNGQMLEGAVYLPGQKVELAGSGTTNCLHVVGRIIHVKGPTEVANGCAATAVRPIIAKAAQLAS